jgi:hypothetical protein
LKAIFIVKKNNVLFVSKKILFKLARRFVYLVRVQILEEVCEERAGGCQNRSVSSNKPCSDVKLDIAK